MVERTCPLCNRSLPIDAFHRRGSAGRQLWCKSCRKTYDADYYRRNRERRTEQKQEWQKAFAEWYVGLKDRPCTDCGGRFHPAAMEWDHLPGHEKVSEIATLFRRKRRRLLQQELEKCELVCANCHAVRTYERMTGRSSAW